MQMPTHASSGSSCGFTLSAYLCVSKGKEMAGIGKPGCDSGDLLLVCQDVPTGKSSQSRQMGVARPANMPEKGEGQPDLEGLWAHVQGTGQHIQESPLQCGETTDMGH